MEQWKLLLILILIFGIFLRILPLGTQATFFEPDNYLYYSIANQTIHNNGIIPIIDNLSGFPQHNAYDEQQGLILLAVTSYEIFSHIGLTLAQSMYLLPIVAAILSILLAFLFTEKLIPNDKNAALFAALMFATLPAAIFKTDILEYRGETFIPVLIALSVYLLASVIEGKISKGNKVIYIFAVISALTLALITWNGAVYIIGILAIFLLLCLIERLGIGTLIAIIIAFGIAITGLFIVHPTSLFSASKIQETVPPNLIFIVADFYFAPLLIALGLYYLIKNEGAEGISNLWKYSMISIFAVAIILFATQSRWAILTMIPIAVFAGIGYEYIQQEKGGSINIGNANIIIGVIIAMSIIAPILQFQGATPTGYQDSSLFTAMNYLSSNTPQNSTVLTDWNDGGFIEGIANRQSYTDSIFGFNGIRTLAFEKFLFEPEGNLSYISTVQPDYLFIRKEWLAYVLTWSSEINYTSNSIEGTNLAMLMQAGNHEGGNVILTQVYNNSNDTIYKVSFTKGYSVLSINTSIKQVGDEAYLQLLTSSNITLQVSGDQISTIVLNPNTTAELPLGIYSLQLSQNANIIIKGTSILNGSKLDLKGNTLLYVNATT